MLTQEHVETARSFIEAADREFAAGDVLQGSEKMWGAAANAVMAVAQQRGWPFGSHRDLAIAVRRLSDEQDDEVLRGGFQAAQMLHANFYHRFMEDFQLDDAREVVRSFVARTLRLMV